MVPTCATTSVMGPLGQAPLCCPGLPPGTLNALYAIYGKCPNAQSLAKWPVIPQTKHRCSSDWKWPITCIICKISPSIWSNSGGSPTTASGSGGNKSTSSSMATLPSGTAYLLYLSIGIRRSHSGPLEAGRLISLHLPC